jgi:hypothetical protein
MSAALDESLLSEPAFEHLVHLYETDTTLARCVLAFLAPGLPDQAALVVATPEHRTLFAEALHACGADVEALRREGRYVEKDAEQTLSTFLRDGVIDPLAFRLSVGETVRGLAARHGKVHVYGEMVACLWGRGDSHAAVTLERAWNDLAGTADFRLCCAYPVTAMTTGRPADVDAVLACHSLVTD